jgi:hypothetical protein
MIVIPINFVGSARISQYIIDIVSDAKYMVFEAYFKTISMICTEL